MSGEANWKLKYQELKAKFMDSVDMAFKLGFEAGVQQSEKDQMMQQQQMQAEQEALMMQNANGQPPQEGGMPGEGAPQDPNQQPQPGSENPAGSELDQHIAKLESMLGKSELGDTELKGMIAALKKSKDSIAFASEMKKSAQAIPAIAKALHKPAFKIGQQASHNLDANAKTAVTMQHKIVNGIMEKWEKESTKAAKEITNVISVEGLTKKEE